MHLRRIAQERANLLKDPLETITACPLNDDSLLQWTATITAPPTSPYAPNTFTLHIHLPENYPHTAPKIFFASKIFHPNVESSTGEVRMAELETQQWCPALTIRTLLISVQALLSDANLEDGCVVNEEAAGLWVRDFEGIRRKVQE